MNIKNQMLGRLTIGEQPKLKLFVIFNITTAYQNSKKNATPIKPLLMLLGYVLRDMEAVNATETFLHKPRVQSAWYMLEYDSNIFISEYTQIFTWMVLFQWSLHGNNLATLSTYHIAHYYN